MDPPEAYPFPPPGISPALVSVWSLLSSSAREKAVDDHYAAAAAAAQARRDSSTAAGQVSGAANGNQDGDAPGVPPRGAGDLDGAPFTFNGGDGLDARPTGNNQGNPEETQREHRTMACHP